MTGLTLRECQVVASGRDGVQLGVKARAVRIAGCAVLDNGQRGTGRHGKGGEGYGIARQGGSARKVRPEDVTLVGNDVRGNHGRVERRRSTADFGRYDLMVDATDDQAF